MHRVVRIHVFGAICVGQWPSLLLLPLPGRAMVLIALTTLRRCKCASRPHPQMHINKTTSFLLLLVGHKLRSDLLTNISSLLELRLINRNCDPSIAGHNNKNYNNGCIKLFM